MLDPDAVDTLIDLGRWHLTAGQPTRAVDVLERAVIGDRTNAVAMRALAQAAWQRGLAPRPLSGYSVGTAEPVNGLVLGYANLQADDADRLVRELARLAEPRRRSTTG